MHLSLHLLSIVNYNRNIEEAQLNTIRKKLEREVQKSYTDLHHPGEYMAGLGQRTRLRDEKVRSSFFDRLSVTLLNCKVVLTISPSSDLSLETKRFLMCWIGKNLKMCGRVQPVAAMTDGDTVSRHEVDYSVLTVHRATPY